MKRDCLFGMCN